MIKNATIKGDYIICSVITQDLMRGLEHGQFSVFKPNNSILCNNRTSLWFLVKLLIENNYELI